METNRPYILAIESAISGGSIAIVDGSTIVAESSGSASVSRAEDLLPSLIGTLNEAGLSKLDLDRIAVSLGPGSYTGLRIGISTVMGLCKGLGIPYVGVPVFESVVASVRHENAFIALPFGRGDVCITSTTTPDRPEIVRLDEISRALAAVDTATVLAHSELVANLDNLGFKVTDIGSNLAKYVATASRELPASTLLDPIYVQNPRFG